MSGLRQDVGESPEPEKRVRHRTVPTRVVDDKVVAARPSDGAPVVLAPTAAMVWRLLDDWTSEEQLRCRLAELFPHVSGAERTATLAAILNALSNDDLLDRS
jgi:hypothetical protein